jgi:hypothetical protein
MRQRSSSSGRFVAVDPVARFMLKTERRGTCLIWIGSATYRGYGKFMTGPNGAQKTHLAHRWIWEHENGPLGRAVLRHSCDTPLCVELKHLMPGTQKDNIQDSLRRGRFSIGSKHWKAVLDEKKVLKIKKRAAAGETWKSIGNCFGVSKSTIGYIVRGKTWKHVQ